MDANKPTEILIVDHQPLFRAGLAQLLDGRAGFAVVDQVGTGAEAVRLSAESQPDVVLMDLDIPDEDPSATLRSIQRSCDSFLIGLSASDDPLVVQQILSMGVSGYLLKTVTVDELAWTIRSVCMKSHHRDGRVTVSISRSSLAQAEGIGSGTLSDREKQIIVLVAEALSNAQIGRLLRITEGTVKRHLRTIFIKLGAVSRIDAVNKAIAANAIPRTAGMPRRPRQGY